MKFTITNASSGLVQVEAEIDCDERAPDSVKLGLAVKWAIKARASLVGADLQGADLSNSDLVGVNFSDANLARANFSYSDLSCADFGRANLSRTHLSRTHLYRTHLSGADLTRATLDGTCGNMVQIKSAQIDTWPIAWVTAPNGVIEIQIGCQRHTRSEWAGFSAAQISRMDPKASSWWGANRDFVLGMVDRFPAVPYGQA